jgi:(p)ppGpp synthase/HD superfamily hydrolase
MDWEAIMIRNFLYSFLLMWGTVGAVSTEPASAPIIESFENKDVVDRYAKSDRDVRAELNKFLSSLKVGMESGALSPEEGEKILKGVEFAMQKHQFQERKNSKKTPYVIHPIGVADHIMRVGKVYDADVIIAALMHDTINEGLATKEELTKNFGKAVASYVEEVTDDQAIPVKERKKKQIIQALHQSKGASLIKLSDKWHNLNTLMKDPPSGWNREKMDLYFQWAQAVAENLPEVNAPLKESLHETIAHYWEAQSVN